MFFNWFLYCFNSDFKLFLAMQDSENSKIYKRQKVGPNSNEEVKVPVFDSFKAPVRIKQLPFED